MLDLVLTVFFREIDTFLKLISQIFPPKNYSQYVAVSELQIINLTYVPTGTI